MKIFNEFWNEFESVIYSEYVKFSETNFSTSFFTRVFIGNLSHFGEEKKEPTETIIYETKQNQRLAFRMKTFHWTKKRHAKHLKRTFKHGEEGGGEKWKKTNCFFLWMRGNDVKEVWYRNASLWAMKDA